MIWKTLALVILLLLAASANSQSQDQDSDSQDSQDSGIQGASDPNLINPQNKQGYGRNVQTQLLPQPKTTPTSKPAIPVDNSIGAQSVQAVLQLGVLVGVALLCGVLFMMMVGFELMCDAVKEKLISMCGRKKVYETVDPASLVGTYKRYK